MAKLNINIGTADKGDGDPLRVAFSKVNDNFTELYNALGLDDNTLNLGAFEFVDSVMSTTDSTAIVIDQATTVTSDLTVGGNILPQIANGGDLGSLAKPFRSLFVSTNTIYFDGVPLSIGPNNKLYINNAPHDISDLSDSRGLLGGSGGSYTPGDSNLWNSPTVNTVSAALDELAVKVAALENYEIDGGNANTPAAGELLIDGNGA